MAKEYGMPALANTDLGNMFGAVEFYFTAKKYGIKPIVGIEAFIAPYGRFEKNEVNGVKKPNTRIVLLAKNTQGYKNLCRISTAGFKEGFYYKPRIDMETLKTYSSDIIALSGGVANDIQWVFENQGKEEAIKRIKEFSKIYPDNYYLEICRANPKATKAYNDFLVEASKSLNVPLVAANDIYYSEPQDQIAQEVLLCIGSNRTLNDDTRYKLGSQEYYFKSTEQMSALYKDIPEAIENTLKIADDCNIEFKIEDDAGNPIYHLPSFESEAGRTPKDEMRFLSEEGLEERLISLKKLGLKIDKDQLKVYRERLDYELGVIDGMGFNGYFLIVQDFINWAKENDIPVGPGRGSGAGSLVAYCLKITDLDPISNGLIFERFLNPERISMPDFDIDFCQENRGRVIQYVTEKYSEASVAQIITYGKLQARAAIRDVGRVLGMVYAEVDVVSKLIPDKLGINLKEALELEPRITDLMEADPKVATLMDLAQKVEGLVRHAGIHAAGVIIADGSIVDHAPLYRGTEDENVVQYDMKHAEKIGLIKFDFLGLKTLTLINDTVKLIKQNKNEVVNIEDISLSDEGIYDILCKGDTAGVFQFEGEGISSFIVKSQPNCFEDIVAITALYRPGPMDMIPTYLKRKKGEETVKYIFPELEDILKETYGIVVYQEQVQLIASKIANYSLGEADLLRRAMGKKIAEVMEEQKVRFLAGAKENEHNPKKAEELFDLMAEFAKYGFNKSHAAAYCVVTAYTAYLKHYHPVEFFAATLSTEMSDTDKIVKYVKDAQKHGITVKTPHINYSDYKFSVNGKEIYFSLGGIKGVGQAAVESIIEARSNTKNGKFETLEEFFDSVDLRRVNKKTIECLIKAGAFDGFGYHRSQLFEGYSRFVEGAERLRNDKEAGQVSLFSMSEDVKEEEKVKLQPMESWPKTMRLAYEKDVLGFYLSDHPLRGISKYCHSWGAKAIGKLSQEEEKMTVNLVGMISSYKEIITKKGTRMAFGELEDLSGRVELIIFPDRFAKYETLLKSEQGLVVTGGLEKEDGDRNKIIVESIQAMSTLWPKVKGVYVKVTEETKKHLEPLRDLVENHQGSTPLFLYYDFPDMKKKALFETEEKIEINQAVLEKINKTMGDNKAIDLRF